MDPVQPKVKWENRYIYKQKRKQAYIILLVTS